MITKESNNNKKYEEVKKTPKQKFLTKNKGIEKSARKTDK